MANDPRLALCYSPRGAPHTPPPPTVSGLPQEADAGGNARSGASGAREEAHVGPCVRASVYPRVLVDASAYVAG